MQSDFEPIVRRMALMISRAGVSLDDTPAITRLLRRDDISDPRALAHVDEAIRMARSWQSRQSVDRSFERR